MPYVTSVERIGIEKGMQQGIQQGTQNALLLLLEKKFGSVANDVRATIEQAEEEQVLAWLEQTLTATCIGDVFGH